MLPRHEARCPFTLRLRRATIGYILRQAKLSDRPEATRFVPDGRAVAAREGQDHQTLPCSGHLTSGPWRVRPLTPPSSLLQEMHRHLDPVALLAEMREVQAQLGNRVDRRAGSPLGSAPQGEAMTEVPPVSWTPKHLCFRSPLCQRNAPHTRLSSGGR